MVGPAASPWDGPGSVLGMGRFLIQRQVPSSSGCPSLLGEILSYSEYTVTSLYCFSRTSCGTWQSTSTFAFWGRKQSFHLQDKRGPWNLLPSVGNQEGPTGHGRPAHREDISFAAPFLLPVIKTFFSQCLGASEPIGDTVSRYPQAPTAGGWQSYALGHRPWGGCSPLGNGSRIFLLNKQESILFQFWRPEVWNSLRG